MNAINLIPAGQRRNRRTITAGAPFLALVGALLLVLVASSVFVLAHNRVESRASRLASLQATTGRWSSAASSYAGVVATEKRNEAAIDNVRTLVGQRADWSELLGQLAEVMPAHSQLASLATTASATPTSTDGDASSPTTTPSTGTSSTAAGASAASIGASSIALSACATSQTVVAETLIALRRITGVSGVSLSSSGSGGSSGGSTAGGNCDYAVPFQVTLTFTPPTFAAGTGAAHSTSVTPSSTSGASGVSQ